MKKLALLVFLFISASVTAQNDKAQEPECFLKLNKESLITLELDCDVLKDRTLTFFKLKVPGQPTLSVKGSKFTNEAKALIQKAKTGDKVILFDIKLLDYKEDIAPIIITLVEYH